MPGHLRQRPTQRSSATPICPPGGDGTRRFLCRSSSKIQSIEFGVASRTRPVALATNVAVFTFQCTKLRRSCRKSDLEEDTQGLARPRRKKPMDLRMRTILALLLTAVLLHSPPAALGAAADHPDFSGTWVLNEDESDAPPQFGGPGRGRGGGPGGPGGPPEGGRGPGGRGGRGGWGRPGGSLYSKMIIKQDGNSLELLPAGTSGEGQPELSLVIGTGPEEIETRRGLVTQEGRWEESELVIHQLQERETRRGTMTIEQQQRWTLSKDGKKLTQEIKTRTPMRDFELFRVFDKE